MEPSKNKLEQLELERKAHESVIYYSSKKQ